MILGMTPFLSSITTRIPSLSDSSRRSLIPSIRLSLTSSAMCSTSRALLTWNGSSLMMIFGTFVSTSSISATPRTVSLPCPVWYADRIPARPMMIPPVGKSGPGTTFSRSSTVQCGRSITSLTASATSRRLWGGMFVAIPTAIPDEPFTSRFGTRHGRTVGSLVEVSKFGMKSTVSFSRSVSRASAYLVSRASVYRIAAGESPSTEPKLPCPSTRGERYENGWAILTSVS